MNEINTNIISGCDEARQKLIENLEQIKLDFKRGRLKLSDIDLMIALAERYLKGEPRTHE